MTLSYWYFRVSTDSIVGQCSFVPLKRRDVPTATVEREQSAALRHCKSCQSLGACTRDCIFHRCQLCLILHIYTNMSDKRYRENLKFPPKTATPNDVRKYVERTLITKHDTTQAFATEVAGRWGIGRGADFRNASLMRFNKTFGEEVGPYLHRTIREHEMDEWEATRFAGYYYCKYRIEQDPTQACIVAGQARANASYK